MISARISEEFVNLVEEQDFLDEQSLLEWYRLHSEEQQESWVYCAAKRTIDICLALVGLVVLGLLLCIIAPLIFLEDRGPLFYHQKRVGRHFQAFTLYKLRTMIIHADDHLAQHPKLQEAWCQTGKLQNDPRVTRIGRFLRRSSIDELPQMFNVLRGELSFVGPRPIQFSEIPALGELVEMRQSVKPGLTGLWQVSGRSGMDYEQRAILDCMYVVDRSLGVDLLIMVKTLSVVLRGMGAY